MKWWPWGLKDPNPVVSQTENLYMRKDGSIFRKSDHMPMNLNPAEESILRAIAGED